jgi:hypothetical protein
MNRSLLINALEPTEFGWQRVGDMNTYLPSPEQIREQCEEIQTRWSKRERARRRAAMPYSSSAGFIDRVEVKRVGACRPAIRRKVSFES